MNQTSTDILGFNLAKAPVDFLENPFPYYHGFLQHAPVLPQPDGSYIVSRYRDLDSIYRDTNTFCSDKSELFGKKFGPNSALFEHHTTSLVFNDPPLHTRIRKVMTSALSNRAIIAMEPGLIHTIDSILNKLPAQPAVDLISDFAAQIPIQIIGNLFDMPQADREPLRKWSLAILGALEPTISDEQQQLGNEAVSNFTQYLKELVADRRRTPGNPETDVLSRLIAADNEYISESELLQNCIFILNAGHETTTNLIGNALYALHEYPNQKKILLERPETIATGVDEFLRFLSPNQFGNRIATIDTIIGGQLIPAGSNLHLCIGAANRDYDVFSNPDNLDLNRAPNPHLAFAGGRHLCVGLSLARMEGRVAINQFLKRYPHYTLTEGAKQGGRIRFRGFSSLPAILK